MTDVAITFDNGNHTYLPRCIKVHTNTTVTFNGEFSFHPLNGGLIVSGTPMPLGSGPFFPATNSGTTKAVTLSAAGPYPFYCGVHGGPDGMNGAIFVVAP